MSLYLQKDSEITTIAIREFEHLLFTLANDHRYYQRYMCMS